MNDITQLSTLYSNAIARAEKAEEALRVAVETERKRCAEVAASWASDLRRNDSSRFTASHIAAAIMAPPPPVRETP